MTFQRVFIVLGALASSCIIARPVEAANCSLRNPDRQIYELFPQATSYRSIVANVEEKAKPAIEEALGSPLVFNDLGKHTLYLVLNKEVPIGFVHPRSEVGKHGSVELVWAMDLDLRVRDFRVQRSREQHTAAIDNVAFRDRLLARDYRNLRTFMADGNTRIDPAVMQAPAEAASIVHIAVLCGAKTLIITEVAFGDRVLQARLMGNVHRFFPGTTSVSKVKASSGADVAASMTSLLGSAATALETDAAVVLRALGGGEETLGFMVFSPRGGSAQSSEMWLAVTPGGAIAEAVVCGPREEGMAADLPALQGKKLAEILALGAATASGAQRRAIEILAWLQVLGFGK